MVQGVVAKDNEIDEEVADDRGFGMSKSFSPSQFSSTSLLFTSRASGFTAPSRSSQSSGGEKPSRSTSITSASVVTHNSWVSVAPLALRAEMVIS